ncbi:MAG TPA: SUF system NifU family Fe-S cluster assembly protein [Balneolales bacterium]|nr:SUF system NifU family Fe-S cluster assembly protein [Balneolales bacterium]
MDNLYSDIIIHHYKSQSWRGKLHTATHRRTGRNATCGDEITLYYSLSDNGIIKDIRFTGKGCMISQASASIMCETVKGKSVKEISELFTVIGDLLTPPFKEYTVEEVRKNEYLALSDMHKYPARKKCALLAWKTLIKAINNDR